ncbi:MerR family transcriptional regulator [Rhodobacter sp. SY28-1]|uniref:MerR family transcriptional regulator n=1 Tax=Rhodobacter sp. SY28-1 TaxID=2562317 RepID=UPI0010C043B7|nr:MerR family transcriptional regulator [Rhodobacter sp. SY28-1]
MDKSPDAFRTISEVAEHLDTPAHVLRFWESRFPQIKPVKRAGGRRYYRPSDVALLTGIKRLLHDEGLTIRGVQKILRDHGVRQVAGLTDDSVSLDDLAITASPAPDVADIATDEAEAGFIAVEDPEEELSSPPPVAAPPPKAPPAQFGLPLFDAPPAFAAPPAPRKPTPRDDATFASLIRALPRGSLQARQPELSGIALRLRALRARLAARADGTGD